MPTLSDECQTALGLALHAIRPTSNTLLSPFSQSPTRAALFIPSCFKLHLSVQLLPHEYKQPC